MWLYLEAPEIDWELIEVIFPVVVKDEAPEISKLSIPFRRTTAVLAPERSMSAFWLCNPERDSSLAPEDFSVKFLHSPSIVKSLAPLKSNCILPLYVNIVEAST